MLSDQMLAEDIVQDVFIKFYENFDKIVNQQSVLFWLFRAAKNEIMDYFRSTKIKTLYKYSLDAEELEIESPKSFEQEFDNQEFTKLLEINLNKLEPEYREIFILREYSHLSYKEIGILIGINEELVKSRLFKIRNKLVKTISKIILD
jgi:RNA polymerase sigma-70 factor (ECF subfamily)